MSAACSTCFSDTFIPTFWASSWMNWADFTVDESVTVVSVNSRGLPVWVS